MTPMLVPMSIAGEDVSRVAVMGIRLIGYGIAQVFTTHGHSVRVTDLRRDALKTVRSRIPTKLEETVEDPSPIERIELCGLLAEAFDGVDYMVEAAAEDLEAKQALFAVIEDASPPTVILASNTTVIPITSIMTGLCSRSRCLGAHWWNPTDFRRQSGERR